MSDSKGSSSQDYYEEPTASVRSINPAEGRKLSAMLPRHLSRINERVGNKAGSALDGRCPVEIVDEDELLEMQRSVQRRVHKGTSLGRLPIYLTIAPFIGKILDVSRRFGRRNAPLQRQVDNLLFTLFMSWH